MPTLFMVQLGGRPKGRLIEQHDILFGVANQVSELDYLPYAFFCYLSLLLTILFGFTGITISRLKSQ